MFEANPKTTNLAGNPKLTEAAPRQGRERDAQEVKHPKDEPNPQHKEDFARLLEGMTRSSE